MGWFTCFFSVYMQIILNTKTRTVIANCDRAVYLFSRATLQVRSILIPLQVNFKVNVSSSNLYNLFGRYDAVLSDLFYINSFAFKPFRPLVIEYECFRSFFVCWTFHDLCWASLVFKGGSKTNANRTITNYERPGTNSGNVYLLRVKSERIMQ
jgi:hypothetical protein